MRFNCNNFFLFRNPKMQIRNIDLDIPFILREGMTHLQTSEENNSINISFSL